MCWFAGASNQALFRRGFFCALFCSGFSRALSSEGFFCEVFGRVLCRSTFAEDSSVLLYERFCSFRSSAGVFSVRFLQGFFLALNHMGFNPGSLSSGDFSVLLIFAGSPSALIFARSFSVHCFCGGFYRSLSSV